MSTEHWIKKTVATSLLLALPSTALLARVYWTRFRRNHRAVQMHFAFWTALIVLGLFICSVVNAVSNWSFMFAVGWPLVGIAISLFGCGLAFSAARDERCKLLLANVLVLILTFASIVAPN